MLLKIISGSFLVSLPRNLCTKTSTEVTTWESCYKLPRKHRATEWTVCSQVSRGPPFSVLFGIIIQFWIFPELQPIFDPCNLLVGGLCIKDSLEKSGNNASYQLYLNIGKISIKGKNIPVQLRFLPWVGLPLLIEQERYISKFMPEVEVLIVTYYKLKYSMKPVLGT